MNQLLGEVQRIVLKGSPWQASCHLVLTFPNGSFPLHFLNLVQYRFKPTAADCTKPLLQVSLGISRHGLEQLQVPGHVLTCFALKAPAFNAGAALRASRHLGSSANDGPASWDPAFGLQVMDAVLSLHSMSADALQAATAEICRLAECCRVAMHEPALGERLPTPAGETPIENAQWVHFGYRDGLSHVHIDGWPDAKPAEGCIESSWHAAGEFLLGNPQTGGANPWIAGPGKRVWPKELRAFFSNGSFGVLHQVEQDVAGFEKFVHDKADVLRMSPRMLKAKLCGRYPDGLPLAADKGARPTDDFDYSHDRHGYCCPFGSHSRRMNPRSDNLAHAARARPLLRRGMPYGPPWLPEADDTQPRGLWAHFFCASIEDQFEHLMGQWADRVPLGSKDLGGARDPLIGAHECGDGDFVMNRPLPQQPLRLWGLRPFTRTRGTAYLFYPSLPTLKGIANGSTWGLIDTDEDENENEEGGN